MAKNRRPLVPADRAEAKKQAREAMREARQRQRLGFERGEEKYLPQRDRGPVRRWVRDWVDARLSLGTLAMPMMMVVLVLTFVREWALYTSLVLWAYVALVVLDSFVMSWQLRKALRVKFSEKDSKGHGFYAAMRAIQLPFLRAPRPQTKLFKYPS